MTWELILLLGLLTYGSRMVALTFLPPMPHAIATVLDRMPPALFAGLAAHALFTPGIGLAQPPLLAAAAAAIAVSPRRSLLLCLLAGLAAYVLAGLVL